MSWWTTSNRLHPKVKNKFIVVFGATFYIPSVKTVGKPKVTFDTKEFRLINHKFNYPGNATWEPITIKFVDMNGDINPKERHENFDTAAFLWQVMNNTGYRYPYINTSNYRDPHFKATKGSSTGHWLATKIDTEKNPGDYKYITTPEKSSTVANAFGSGLSGKRDTKAASSTKQRISIYQIDPDGYTVELWHLVNPIVKSIGWGDLDYGADELVEYELQVAYDWAILDRDAIGKEPEFSATEFSEFMKTIYVTNQIDINNALDKKIEKLKEMDERLDVEGADLNAARSVLDEEIMAAKMIADPGAREEALEGLLTKADAFDEAEESFAQERQEQQELMEEIINEATEIDPSMAESLETELMQDLNVEEEAFIANENAQDLQRQEIEEEIAYTRQDSNYPEERLETTEDLEFEKRLIESTIVGTSQPLSDENAQKLEAINEELIKRGALQEESVLDKAVDDTSSSGNQA